jgi:hypothetical protein
LVFAVQVAFSHRQICKNWPGGWAKCNKMAGFRPKEKYGTPSVSSHTRGRSMKVPKKADKNFRRHCT